MTTQPIKPIDKASIHRLTSGQVITDLQTAVKELVDNAIDAGATSLDIRLSDYGSALIEVSDNGVGISPEDRPLLAKKYYTSKLSSFDDLETLSTLGFRGEALSSLCAVAHVSAVTKTCGEECGVKLEYDAHGELSSELMMARSVGTTISVRDLFHSLPVRRKEFEKNLKRDYGKLVRVLQSYALIGAGVRFVCTNQVGNGARSIVVQSSPIGGSNDRLSHMKNSARSIFGKKIADGMLAVHRKDDELGVEVIGLVSGAGTGIAKGRGDGRHFYVNARPIEFKKAGTMLYEVYRNYVSPTHTQRPACVLDVCISPDRVDVNVTPDKRTVFFHDEAAICRFLQNCVMEAWEGERGKYAVGTVLVGVRDRRGSQLELSQAATSVPDDVIDSPSGVSPAFLESVRTSRDRSEGNWDRTRSAKADRRIDEIFAPQPREEPGATVCDDASAEHNVSNTLDNARMQRLSLPSQTSLLQKRKAVVIDTSLKLAANPTKPAQSLLEFALKQSNADYILRGSTECRGDKTGEIVEAEVAKRARVEVDVPTMDVDIQAIEDVDQQKAQEHQHVSGADAELMQVPRVELKARALGVPQEQSGKQPAASVDCPPRIQDRETRQSSPIPSDDVNVAEKNHPVGALLDTRPEAKHVSGPGLPRDDIEGRVRDEDDQHILAIDMNKIREVCMRRARDAQEQGLAASRKASFAAASLTASNQDTTADIHDQTAAEDELQRVFQKDQFKQMEVIGQFNLGFIIAKLGDDLFIVDQHASDEKHTFENLQRTTKFQKQRLICPIEMDDLTPRDKEIIQENVAVFSNSGFEFDETVGGTLRLTSVPHCKGITFSSADVLEMVDMIDRGERSLWHLEAGANKRTGGRVHASRQTSSPEPSKYAVYPSRFRALLASKACRTSIMIGKALTRKKMQEILANLSTLVSPWNCPHGRPTMRHLAYLNWKG